MSGEYCVVLAATKSQPPSYEMPYTCLLSSASPVIAMWLLCDCYVIVMWLLCDCYVIVMWLLCDCYVIAMCLLSSASPVSQCGTCSLHLLLAKVVCGTCFLLLAAWYLPPTTRCSPMVSVWLVTHHCLSLLTTTRLVVDSCLNTLQVRSLTAG